MSCVLGMVGRPNLNRVILARVFCPRKVGLYLFIENGASSKVTGEQLDCVVKYAYAVINMFI
jgi:hypothetical protein